MNTYGDGSDILNRYQSRVRVSENDPGWVDMWPSETRGNGQVRKNNANTGGAQGKGTLLRKAACNKCGFINDLSAIDHTGGSIDGEGAGGGIATAVVSAPTSAPPSINGQTYTHTENIGTQSYRRGAGCAFCLTKNSTRLRIIIDYVSPLNSPLSLGFIFLLAFIVTGCAAPAKKSDTRGQLVCRPEGYVQKDLSRKFCVQASEENRP